VIVGRLEAAPSRACHDHAKAVSILTFLMLSWAYSPA